MSGAQEHTVNGKRIQFAGDVEGHIGADSNFYLLDLQRCFPPEEPRLWCRGCVVPVDAAAPTALVPSLLEMQATTGVAASGMWQRALVCVAAALTGADSSSSSSAAAADATSGSPVPLKCWSLLGKRAHVVALAAEQGREDVAVNQRLSHLAGRVVRGAGVFLSFYGYDVFVCACLGVPLRIHVCTEGDHAVLRLDNSLLFRVRKGNCSRVDTALECSRLSSL